MRKFASLAGCTLTAILGCGPSSDSNPIGGGNYYVPPDENSGATTSSAVGSGGGATTAQGTTTSGSGGGTTGSAGGAGGAGTGTGGGATSGTGGGAPPVDCTSGQFWTSGDNGSNSMTPGKACIACHDKDGEAPHFQFAGTVYPSQHEVDNCFGSPNVTVEVTDANGQVVTVQTQGAGNFKSSSPLLAFPIKAKITYMGNTLSQQVAVSSGDCNSCHTEDGANGAPGRLYLP